MKRNLKIVILTFGIIFGSVSIALAQGEVIVGGYGAVDANQADVVAAAKYAVKKHAKNKGAKIKLISVNKAETQVVAGLNYRLCLNVEIKEKGKKTYAPATIETVVFKNLDQKLSLTSWEEVACASARARP